MTNLPDISSAPRIPGPMRNEYQQQIIQFSQRLEEIAARHGVTIFDIYTITTQRASFASGIFFELTGFIRRMRGMSCGRSRCGPRWRG